jgi:hypothetical protein
VDKFKFQSDLANMLFNTPADPSRDVFESDLVERFREAASVMQPKDISRHAAKIDNFLLPKLSGRNFLAVAKLIEMRQPSAIENMPRLSKQRKLGAQAAELAQILSPLALERVIEALRAAEANR